MILTLAALGHLTLRAPSAFAAPPAQNPVTTPTSITLKPGDRTYTVEPGDSFWSIAQKVYGAGSKYTLILQANNLTEKTPLRVGAVLIVPGAAETPVPAASTARSQAGAPVTPTLIPTAPPPGQITAVPTLAPTPQPTTVPTLPAVSVVGRSQPPVESTPTDPSTGQSAGNPPSGLRNQQLLTALDILSGIFAATSVICAFLAYQSYNRAKQFEKKAIVRRRARSHPDLI